MIENFITLCKKYSNKKQAIAMQAYMKNLFPFCGIPSPLRKTLEKEWFSTFDIPTWKQLKSISRELRNLPEREYQYTAITLLEKHKKLRVVNSIKFFEKLIITKSWRDTVDSIDTNLIGKYFLTYPEQKEIYAVKRSRSHNIRFQRTAIQFQLLYKEKVDTNLIEKIFTHTKDSKEFFVQKAMGRMLREYSKKNVNWVHQYINNNTLPKLTIREGSKYL